MSSAASHAALPAAAPRALRNLRWPPRIVFPASRALLTALVVPAFLVAVWAVAGALDRLPELIVPPVGAVVSSLQDLAQSGDLASALIVSLRRLVFGFATGAAVGLSAGAVTGLSNLGRAILLPSLTAFVQVPVLAWIPLLMIPLGIGENLKVIAIGVAAFAPVALNAGNGFRGVTLQLVEVGTLYRLTPVQRLRYILLPGALPTIATGLRLGMTQAWQSLVVVELVASTDGIGYLTVEARQMFRLDQMLATMIVIGIVGFVLDRTLREVQVRLGRHFGQVAA